MSRIIDMVLYKQAEKEPLFREMCWLMTHYADEEIPRNEKAAVLAGCVEQFAGMASQYGFGGNLWQAYLTYLMVNDENAYSMACEISGRPQGSIHLLADHDFNIFRELFAYDFSDMEKVLETQLLTVITAYENGDGRSRVFNQRIRARISQLSEGLADLSQTADFKQEVTRFYEEFGVGKLGLHKAFRVVRQAGREQAGIVPITNIAHVNLDDLVGYELPKQKLIANTEAFVAGRRANNCLLFGDAGTGKSSSIKGILNRYYDQGLRIIEVYKHQFKDLNDVIGQIKNRNYRFIIYMDDLSFEEFETEYKYLKAVIEGGLEKKPENVLIYATSNRRHLIKESFSDKEGRRDDLHSSDTVQEKLSLVYRFGVSIFFGGPDRKEFQNIVQVLAQRNGIKMPVEELLAEANKWELYHGGLSGRTAQQFIDYLLGKV